MSGINADGSAIATKAGHLKKADRSKNYLVDPPFVPTFLRSTVGKPLMLHSVNKPELVQRISSAITDKGQPREKAWANELDAVLRDSFRQGCREHLLNRAWKGRRYSDYWFMANICFFTAADIAQGSPSYWPGIYGGLWALGVGLDSLSAKKFTGSSLASERRWSIFYRGHQTDRYVALNALSRVSRLVYAKK